MVGQSSMMMTKDEEHYCVRGMRGIHFAHFSWIYVEKNSESKNIMLYI